MIDYQKWQFWHFSAYAQLRVEQISALALLGERKKLLGVGNTRRLYQ